MSQLILTRSSQSHRALRTYGALPLSMRVGKFFLLFGMTFMIGVLSFFYLMEFTQIHTKGYELRRLEVKKDSLITAQEIKSTDIAKLKSLNTIRESSITSGMIPARNPIYIKRDGTVATLPSLGSTN